MPRNYKTVVNWQTGDAFAQQLQHDLLSYLRVNELKAQTNAFAQNSFKRRVTL
jgi:hypothetical protein